MHPDDVKAALDALASEVPNAQRGPGEAAARGRHRMKQRRLALAGIAAVLVAAVTIVGTVSHTSRDGNRITSVPSTTAPFVPRTGESRPHPSSIFPSTLEAWKCGNPLRFTDDGGNTWRDIALPSDVPPGGGLLCTALPGGNAWMLFGTTTGSPWKILRVRDFTKVDVFSLPRALDNTSFGAPTFVDADHGWLAVDRQRAGQPRMLYRTSDGGGTWTVVSKSDAFGPSYFANASDGWAIGGAKVLLATADGGKSWHDETLPAPAGASERDIAHFEIGGAGKTLVVHSGVHIVDSQYRTFFDVTTDGGRTWTIRNGPAGFELPRTSNYFDTTDATHWALTSGHELRVTSDTGRTWEVRPDLPLTENGNLLPPLRFPTPDIGWIMTGRGRILRTADGGRTWVDVTNGGTPKPVGTTTTTTTPPAPPPQPVNIPIAVASASDAWLCGEPLQHTSDGGAGWKFRDVPQHAPARPGDAYPLCAATPGGNLWCLTESRDPGQPEIIRFEPGHPPRLFRFPRLAVNKTIIDFTFADAQHGWALSNTINGSGGDLYATTDGGITWSVLERNSAVSGLIRFTNAIDGWASSAHLETSLLRTTDGGRTWQPVRVPTPKALPGLASGVDVGAVTPDAIIAIGSAPTGNLTHLFFDVSTDGGNRWTMRTGPTNRPFGTTEPRAFSAVDANHWQLSGLNWLWTTADGGRTWTEVAQFAGLSQIDSVAFLTPDVGFVSGRGGRLTQSATVVRQTTDGGASWTTVSERVPPLTRNTGVVNFPGGIVGCPTRPLTPPPPGNPPRGLVDAAKVFMRPEPQTVGQVYRVGQNPKGSFGSLFKFQVGSCGDETVANAWVVELYGPIGQGGGGSTDQTQLALAHSADGWHVFGRYH